jgi:hypothetical protein
MSNIKKIALFTTVYPEGKQFLPDFFTSLSTQKDKKFDLWVGLDRTQEAELDEFFSDIYKVIFIERKNTESNSSFRQRAIELMIERYNIIIFVDSDDILSDTRVSSSRSSLEYHDMYGCAMKIIGEQGEDLNLLFDMPPDSRIESILPRFNIFGMSNTCYSSDILKKCLPFPIDCVLLDWFVATRAWALGARIYFDPVQRMSYRQHSLNIARVIAPFTEKQIIESTKLVLAHYNLVLSKIPELHESKRRLIQDSQEYVELFYSSISKSPEKFREYVRRLNNLPINHIWWSCVAYPDLEDLWRN